MRTRILRAVYREIKPLGGWYAKVFDGKKCVFTSPICTQRYQAVLAATVWVRANYNVVRSQTVGL